MNDAAPCGLRTPHPPHTFNEGSQECPGIPYADDYQPRHRGPYRHEGGWLRRHLHAAARHRAAGDANMVGPPPVMRPRPQLGWKNGDDKGDDQ